MFLFAKLVLFNLYEQTSRTSLLEELQPEISLKNWTKRKKHSRKIVKGRLLTLVLRYQRILDRILDCNTTERQKNATRLLGWLACATRPLKWYEIQGAVSVDLENHSVNFEERKYRENSKDICASLVEIRSDNSIELVHSTARE
jgi:hypothetical protein